LGLKGYVVVVVCFSCLLNLYLSVGKVIVDGRVVNKAGTQVSDKSVIEIKAEIPKYVCR